MMRKITVSGDGRSRGRQHGEELRDLVREHQARWADALRADLDTTVNPYLAMFFAETDFLPAIQRHTPDLLEEVRGIAEGAGVPFGITLARQLSDEEPWFRRRIKLGTTASSACSSIGVDGGDGRPTLLAQNMDMPAWCDGNQILMEVNDTVTGTRALMFTLAGKISLNGVNSDGIGICCNGMAQLDYCFDGLPEDFVVRGFLSHRTLSDGLAFMHRVKHASGQNYVVGGPGSRAINLEVSAENIVEWRPAADGALLFHTNHAMANEDQDTFREQSAGFDELELRKFFYGTSKLRMAALEQRFDAPYNAIDTSEIIAALSDHNGPICRHGETEGMADHFTIGCMIMELGEQPRLHVAPGPPCSTPFEIHTI